MTCIQINLRFSAELQLLLKLTAPPTAAAFHQLNPRVFLSCWTHTNTLTHTQPLSLARRVGAAPEPCPPRRESGVIRAGQRTRRPRATRPGLQNVLAKFTSLLTSLSTLAHSPNGKLCSAVCLLLHTRWCVCAVHQHAVPLYSYSLNWRGEANARDLIMSC